MPYEIKNNGLQNFEIITVEETDWDTIPIKFSSCNEKGDLFSRGDNVSIRLKENEPTGEGRIENEPTGEGRIIEIRGKWVLILWYYDMPKGLCESTYVDVVPIESIEEVSKIEFGNVVVQRHHRTGYPVAKKNSKVLWIHNLFTPIDTIPMEQGDAVEEESIIEGHIDAENAFWKSLGPIIPIKTYDTSSPLDYDDPEEIYVRENADIM